MTNRQFYKYKDASLPGMSAADVTPLVSVVVPLFNAEKYIADTISSVLAQTYKNWELIIIDDCSEDNSYEIAERFSNCDSRIHLIKKSLILELRSPEIKEYNWRRVDSSHFSMPMIFGIKINCRGKSSSCLKNPVQ